MRGHAAVRHTGRHPLECTLLEVCMLVGNGKPQLYGTQFKNVVAHEPPERYPVQDEAHLAQRRIAPGLVQMAG